MNSKKQKVRRFAVGFCLLAILLAILTVFDVAAELRRLRSDVRYRNFNRATPASRAVVVIDIDEQSLKLLEPHLGRWPWNRYVFKSLLEFLGSAEPKAVLFDVLFSERLRNSLKEDEELAQISGELGFVSHAMNFLEMPAEDIPGLNPLPERLAERFAIRWVEEPGNFPRPAKEFRDYSLSLPPFLDRLSKLHGVTFEMDRDGIFRRAPLLFPYGSSWFPSLTLAGVMATVEDPRLKYEDGRLQVIGKTGVAHSIPVDSEGLFPVHYYRPDRGPEIIPIGPVLSTVLQMLRGIETGGLKVSPEEFKDRIVIVGASAAGLEDLKVTPVHTAVPGALIHATAISNVLNREFVRWLPNYLMFPLILLVVSLVYAAVVFFERMVLKVVGALSLVMLFNLASILLFKFYSLHLDAMRVGILSVFAVLDGLVFLNLLDTAEKRKLRATLSKYLAPAVAEELIARGNDPRAEVGREAEVTVLFLDVRNFTQFAEKSDPREVVTRLNAHLKAMTEVVFQHTGTLDKFLGDGLMVFWGAPLPDAEHALKGVRCALAMREHDGPFQIGVGVHTGTAIVGNIGSETRLDYTLIGDTVNLASRLESLSKDFGASIVIGPVTYEKVKHAVLCRPLGRISIRGRDKRVAAYEPLCLRASNEAAKWEPLVREFERAFELLEAEDLDGAMAVFRAMGADPVARRLYERLSKGMNRRVTDVGRRAA